MAGDWTVVPRFTLSQTYSDNINLSPTNREDDFVTRVTPGLSLRGKGARVEASIDYNLQSLTYINSNNRNSLHHQLQGNVDTEIIRDRFFVDANASSFQALIDTNGRFSNRRFSLGNSNRTNVITWGIRPYFKHHFGNWADLVSGIGYSDTFTDNGAGGGGGGLRYDAALTSGTRFSRLQWAVKYQRREISGSRRGNRTESNFGDVRVTAKYALSRAFSFDSMIGFEDNQYSGMGRRSRFIWSVGGTFTPNRRTSLSGSYGERTFGSTKQFSFRHRRRRIAISGQYREELRTSNDILRSQVLVPQTDAFGNQIFDPFGQNNFDVPLDVLTITDDVFVDRSFNAQVSYFKRRDTFTVGVYRSDRESQQGQESQQATGFNASWQHTFSRRLAGGIRGSFQDGSGGGLNSGIGRFGGGLSIGGFNPTLGVTNDAPGDSKFYTISPYISYTLGPHVSTYVGYSYLERIADNPLAEYYENTVSGSLTYAF